VSLQINDTTVKFTTYLQVVNLTVALYGDSQTLIVQDLKNRKSVLNMLRILKNLTWLNVKHLNIAQTYFYFKCVFIISMVFTDKTMFRIIRLQWTFTCAYDQQLLSSRMVTDLCSHTYIMT